MFRTLPWAALAALTIFGTGCSGGVGSADASPADTLTRRQKNEIISTLPIPGAKGVGRTRMSRRGGWGASRAPRSDGVFRHRNLSLWPLESVPWLLQAKAIPVD